MQVCCGIKKGSESFIVEGNIGSGKSTFLKMVAERLPFQAVYEPHTKWQNVGEGNNLLERFYEDTPRWAYTFQSYAFITRIMEQQKKFFQEPDSVQLVERSVYSDRYCFAKNCLEMGTMSELEWQLYKDWFAWLVENYAPVPTGFIYLQADPAICLERLKKRARQEEVGVSLEYLQALHDKHEQWLIKKEGVTDTLKQIPVLVLCANYDFENDHAVLQEYVDKVAAFAQLHIKYQENRNNARQYL